MYITGSREERDWAEDHRHSAVHQTKDPHYHRVQGSGLCFRQGHLGTYHLRFWWSGDDWNGTDFFSVFRAVKVIWEIILPWLVLTIHRGLNWGQEFCPPPPSFCEHKKVIGFKNCSFTLQAKPVLFHHPYTHFQYNSLWHLFNKQSF